MPRRLQFAFHERLVDDELSRFVCEWRLPDQFDLPGKRLEIHIRSTPTEMASTRLKCFECLASTGVNASGTMFPTFTFSGQTRVKPSSREPCGDFPAASGQEWRLIDSNVATATGPGRAGDNSQMDTSAKTGEGFTFSISAKKERFPASSILAGFPRT